MFAPTPKDVDRDALNTALRAHSSLDATLSPFESKHSKFMEPLKILLGPLGSALP